MLLRAFIVVVFILVVGLGAMVIVVRPDFLPEEYRGYATNAPLLFQTGQTELADTINQVEPAVMGVQSKSAELFQEDTSTKPFHQKAMEFAQYQYCQQVVTEYEMRNDQEK